MPYPSAETNTSDPLLLIWRVAEHDEQALEILYEKFQKYVLAIARRLLRSDFEAEEVLQDVFLALWRHPPEVHAGLPSLLTWLSVTTRNQCWMRHRRYHRGQPGADTPHDAEHAELLFEKLAEAELRSNLEKEFLLAPQKHRQVLCLTYYEDIGATEIARRLHLPVITVRKRLDAAVALLRRRHSEAIERRSAPFVATRA
jgi:RNA polymerase sigma-70 factor (ECF subfamily)